MWSKLEKTVLGVLGVATSTPHTVTRTPTATGGPKVRAEQPFQPLLQLTTSLAIALPVPKAVGTA
jgi:hypothetical protein